ncbi:MAG: sensor histidine kinase [Chitinophagales bacterium]|nr:sensor histidine kinase [Hyphomicrobiales bacterium]
MTIEAASAWEIATGGSAKPTRMFRWRLFANALTRRLRQKYSFTSLTRRIVVLNVFGLIILVAGILYLNQFRAGLIDTRGDTLLEHGKLIALTLAEKASAEAERLIPGSDLMLQMPSGLRDEGGEISASALSFALNPETVTPVIRQIAKSTGLRARLYNEDGVLLADSKRLYSNGQVLRFDFAPVEAVQPGFFERAWIWVKKLSSNRNLPEYRDIGSENGKAYKEIKIALTGQPVKMVSITAQGETIVSASVPVQRMRTVMGALLLTSPEGEIDRIIAKEHMGILYTAGFVVFVTCVLSVLLAGTIAEPMRRLANAAERVRMSIRSREQIPDFTHRSDEIGHLSRALRDMTTTLFQRVDATECFAADVAHELKNPLTSLRSAADTLHLCKSDEERTRLVDIIKHDVRRMDRLIDDISDVSRLDAEMTRENAEPIDIAKLLTALCPVINDIHRPGTPLIALAIERPPVVGRAKPDLGFLVNAHDSRLSQVLNNVIDNAISFSPQSGTIYVTAKVARKLREVEIAIEDEGPGIAPENLKKVFTRFYTDRPAHEDFGQNSGLGLHISQQIINAHGGRIWAENRTSATPRRSGSTLATGEQIYGARFVIRLPLI